MGFRALKKTLEAPYTTKVNNRVHTSRGTTPYVSFRSLRLFTFYEHKMTKICLKVCLYLDKFTQTPHINAKTGAGQPSSPGVLWGLGRAGCAPSRALLAAL